MTKFNYPEHRPKTFCYVVELLEGNRRCNACGSIVLRQPPETSMHAPPKPYQCLNCDVEIDAGCTTVGDWQTDEEFVTVLADADSKLLLDAGVEP